LYLILIESSVFKIVIEWASSGKTPENKAGIGHLLLKSTKMVHCAEISFSADFASVSIRSAEAHWPSLDPQPPQKFVPAGLSAPHF